ncbi:hypothetical protein [Pseudovibrio exalbescens]|uniref:hypothetical protein n=1 Tax=Pseudovibrio exalbescens TaxID=197461 RepID=UPI0003F58993|nr:hypothetical protein [Pseudovibrio exalbescens]
MRDDVRAVRRRWFVTRALDGHMVHIPLTKKSSRTSAAQIRDPEPPSIDDLTDARLDPGSGAG